MIDEKRHKSSIIKDMNVHTRENNKFSFIIFIIILTLILCAYPFYRIIQICPIYFDEEVRNNVLNAVFFVRETYGIAISDLSVNKVTGSYVIIREKYHGLINQKIDNYYKVDFNE